MKAKTKSEIRAEIQEILKTVKDPELGMDIVTLGLVREITPDEDGTGAEIVMTLTSPFCPFVDVLIENIENAVGKLFDESGGGAVSEGTVRVEISFDPPWEPPEEIRAMLGV